MHVRALFLALLALAYSSQSPGAPIDGRYSAQLHGESIGLEIELDPSGTLSGNMGVGGMMYSIRGKLADGKLSGTMRAFDEELPFSGRFADGAITMRFVEADEYGAEDGGGQDETLVFRRSDGSGTQIAPPASAAAAPPAAPPAAAAAPAGVVINGMTLDQAQIAELTQSYGQPPQPGSYWYDAKSGLYGVAGHAAFGFMLPGHPFGKLDARASQGDTKVIVNGRELPRLEWATWSRLLGYAIMPGAYWLDAAGNTGYEGSPFPTDNLYAAAQRNAGGAGGGGGGGDNFWSSRFSAGNYDSGNTRGYVSVPGYGPVGYGF